MSDLVLLLFELLNISTIVYASNMFASKCSNWNTDYISRASNIIKEIIWITIYLYKIMT